MTATRAPERNGALAAPSRVRLRILATSDIHMHLLAHDYYTGRETPGRGLAPLASVVARLREEGPALLLDNGDMFQGNPLADHLGEAPPEGLHPAIAVMNAMGFDAATLGNHDFGYGLDWLEEVMAGAAFPIISSNASLAARPTPWRRTILLERRLPDAAGQLHLLRIGIFGVLPPQTPSWEAGLGGALKVEDILTASARAIADLRAEGADVVIALAHSGIGPPEPAPLLENAVAAMSQLAGLDAIIAGHAHELFPPECDGEGLLNGIPAAMPGFAGSHLAEIILELERSEAADLPEPAKGSRVAGSPPRATASRTVHTIGQTSARAPEPHPLAPDAAASPTVQGGAPDPDRYSHANDQASASPPSPRWRRVGGRARLIAAKGAAPAHIAALVGPAHRATLAAIARPVARTDTALSSHFALLGADAGLRLIAAAKRAHLAALLARQGGPELPILCAVSPFRAGGRGGPLHYTHVRPGVMRLSDIAELYQFTNHLTAVIATGAALRGWLERAASIFAQIAPGAAPEPLIRPQFPAYQFDVMDGLAYEIDLSAPPAFNPDGTPTGAPGRIRNLSENGRALHPEDEFIVATNSYRLAGVSLYASLPDQTRHLLNAGPVRDILRDYCASEGQLAPSAALPFRLIAPQSASAIFDTSPDADPNASPLPLALLGTTAEGFARYRVCF
ncbi:MAG: 5'-nucleotidase C-terminal domain-containing protein [Paracoccus sp. (in: a-proteobacteria)]|nr:5'-nucleotidase C-terminal domain-containing protein [Paracoccus sp. (in: a-proteobacteria)]